MAIKKHFLASVAALALLGAGGGPPPDPETPTELYYDDLLPTYSRVAEWGLRAMHDGYTGNVIKIRDVVSNVETDLNVAALAAYVAPFQTAFSASNLGDTPDWVDYTLRMRFTAANFGKGRFCKFAIKAHSTQGLTVDEVWLHRGTGSNFETTGDGIRILFAGSTGFTAVGGASTTCDEFELPLLADQDPGYWILSVHSTAGGYDWTTGQASQTGGYKTGNYTKDSVGTGWNTSGTTGNVVTLFQTRLFPAVTTIYDQTGLGSHLTQTTATKQALLDMHRTGARKPALVFDGVDDFYRDPTASTTRPYMVATPLHIDLAGSRTPRNQWGKIWGIPNNIANNSSPYARLIVEIDNQSSLKFECQTRVDSAQTSDVKMFGWNNLKGWTAHALVPPLGKFLQHGAPSVTVPTDSTVTYPNSTAFFLAANALGAECNGMNWIEHVVFDVGSPVEADVQAAIDKVSWKYMTGDNRYYKLKITGSFGSDQYDAGMAEFEAHVTIGGTDKTIPTTPWIANKRYNGTETWEAAIDDNTSTYYSSGSSPASTPPELYFTMDRNALIVETSIKARGDSFFQYTAKKFILYRWSETGWEAASEVDNTAKGNASGQTYTNFIAWPRPARVKQSAAYWRMRVHVADGDNVQLGEMKFKDAEGTDLCTGGTILKSSQYDSGTPYFGAVNAFDKSLTTGWAALGYAGQWLGYQFSAEKVVNEFQFNASNSYPSLYPRSICIDYSLNGTDWKPYDGWRDATSMIAQESRSKVLTPPDKAWVGGKHRYWRVRPMGTKTSSTIIARLWFLAGATDSIISAGGSAIESGHESTWYNSFLWERGVYSYGWQAPISAQIVPGASWVGWDFGAGNEQDITACKMSAYATTQSPYGCFIEYSDDGTTWIVRDSFCYEWVSNYEEKTFTFPT